MFSPSFRFLAQRCAVNSLRRPPFSVSHRITLHGCKQGFGQRHRRMLSTPAPHIAESTLSMERYHQLSDSAMEGMVEHFEELLDGMGSRDYEVDYHSGVLTLSLGDKGTYVINKQPPNKQIWLSSPSSGPKRYDYVEDTAEWVYSRDGRTLTDLLNEELSKALDQEVNIELRQ